MSRTISVVSGKGGVGKTISAINLAHALFSQGKDVLLVDGDLNSPNLHHYLGGEIVYSIHDVLNNRLHFTEIIHKHPSGIETIPPQAE